MRVWIIDDKRWGDSEETHWIAEVCHDPRPNDAERGESVWDRVEYRGRRFKTEAEARAAVVTMKSNVCNSAVVFRRYLEQIEGTRWSWAVGETHDEVECIYDPATK